jgi:hypothetical protein
MTSEQPAPGLAARLEAAGFAPVPSMFVAAGGLCVLAANSVLNWFREGRGFFGGAGSNSQFADVHRLIERTADEVAKAGISSHVSFGMSRVYFSWLGWVLLAAALGFGALAVSSVGGRHFSARWFGAVVAATGIGATVSAIKLITFEGNPTRRVDAPSYGEYFSHTGFGFWFAVVGYALVLIGCLVPRRMG